MGPRTLQEAWPHAYGCADPGAEPAERPYKVADSDGLYLLVQPSGALLWRFRYRCCGIERKLSLGSFPDVSLVQARRKRDEAKAELDDGIDPVEEKRQRRLKAELAAQTTFALVAGEYIEKMEREGRSLPPSRRRAGSSNFSMASPSVRLQRSPA